MQGTRTRARRKRAPRSIYARLIRGLTLIELVLAIAIASILAAVALPMYQDYITRAEQALAVGDVENISDRILTYFLEYAQYPDTLADIGMGETLDPWGSPYQYLRIEAPADEEETPGKGKGKGKGGKGGVGKLRKDKNLVPINTDYDLYSMGKDGRSVRPLTAKHSRDDIIRANNGAYIGVAEYY